jgi:hypothetical protein
MTLIAGAVGTDGIVLAADQRVVVPSRNECEMDDTYGMCKIVDVPAHCVAYACAGDVLTANVGEALKASVKASGGNFVMDAPYLQNLAKKVWEEMKRTCDVNPINRVMLAVDYRERPHLWRLNVLGPNSHAVEVPDIAFAGSLGNTARFFAAYYEPDKSIVQLSFLAAHIVLVGGRIDPLYVNGLNLALYSAGRCAFLEQAELAELRERSIGLHERIRRELYASNSAISQT